MPLAWRKQATVRVTMTAVDTVKALKEATAQLAEAEAALESGEGSVTSAGAVSSAVQVLQELPVLSRGIVRVRASIPWSGAGGSVPIAIPGQSAAVGGRGASDAREVLCAVMDRGVVELGAAAALGAAVQLRMEHLP